MNSFMTSKQHSGQNNLCLHKFNQPLIQAHFLIELLLTHFVKLDDQKTALFLTYGSLAELL